MIEKTNLDKLNADLLAIGREIESFFQRVTETQAAQDNELGYHSEVSPSSISHADRHEFVPGITDRLGTVVTAIVNVSRSSALVDDVDRQRLRRAFREVSAALRFKSYEEWDPKIENDEDRVLAVIPAGQRETGSSLEQAHDEFLEAYRTIRDVLRLVYPTDVSLATAIARAEVAPVKRYRPNTAFIMMWITKSDPQLEDVKNCIKDVFKEFGIAALRSDEIEHQDVITTRILDEISSSEFLIADLTGERPSVYYEVGYAHALGKRPILYRRSGTPLHFDLAVHNVPEYANITDLRENLRNRLSVITNREPEKPSG